MRHSVFILMFLLCIPWHIHAQSEEIELRGVSCGTNSIIREWRGNYIVYSQDVATSTLSLVPPTATGLTFQSVELPSKHVVNSLYVDADTLYLAGYRSTDNCGFVAYGEISSIFSVAGTVDVAYFLTTSSPGGITTYSTITACDNLCVVHLKAERHIMLTGILERYQRSDDFDVEVIPDRSCLMEFDRATCSLAYRYNEAVDERFDGILATDNYVVALSVMPGSLMNQPFARIEPLSGLNQGTATFSNAVELYFAPIVSKLWGVREQGDAFTVAYNVNLGSSDIWIRNFNIVPGATPPYTCVNVNQSGASPSIAFAISDFTHTPGTPAYTILESKNSDRVLQFEGMPSTNAHEFINGGCKFQSLWTLPTQGWIGSGMASINTGVVVEPVDFVSKCRTPGWLLPISSSNSTQILSVISLNEDAQRGERTTWTTKDITDKRIINCQLW